MASSRSRGSSPGSKPIRVRRIVGALAHERDLGAHLDRGQRERLRRQGAIDGGGPARRRSARTVLAARRPRSASGRRPGCRWAWRGRAGPRGGAYALAGMRDEQDRAGSVLAGVDDLVRPRASSEYASGRRKGLARIVPASAGRRSACDHDAISRLQPRVVVVTADRAR